MTNANTWTVILAGGSGTRFWPLSTEERPKQFLPLAGTQSMLEDTWDRVLGISPAEHILVVTSARHADLVAATLPALPAGNILAEPCARGTAPALAWAASEIRRRDSTALMLSVHADALIQPANAFVDLVQAMIQEVGDSLATVGVVPVRPDTGFGYIRSAPPAMDDGLLLPVQAFVEKPDLDTAVGYVESGNFLWNTGIFLWRAGVMLDELGRVAPEMRTTLEQLHHGDVAGAFGTAPNLSVDEGLLERTARVVVARATFSWDDLGTWEALSRVRDADSAGNVTCGPLSQIASRNNIVWSDSTPVALLGVDDMVVVHAGGRILVARRDRLGELRDLVRAAAGAGNRDTNRACRSTPV
jgi:mannose-1-phosphate guanylyltransferase